MVMAGTDTSAVGAAFTTVMLSKYSEVQEKIYEEQVNLSKKFFTVYFNKYLPLFAVIYIMRYWYCCSYYIGTLHNELFCFDSRALLREIQEVG